MEYRPLNETNETNESRKCLKFSRFLHIVISAISAGFMGAIYINVRNASNHIEKYNFTEFIDAFVDIKECIEASGICS